jgi:hypothetical protein
MKQSPRAKGSPPPPQFRPARARYHFDSPRKASAPAVLSPSQQDDLLSLQSHSSSKQQRSTLAGLEGSEYSSPSKPYGGHGSRRSTERQSSIEHSKMYPRNANTSEEKTAHRPSRITKRTSLSALVETGFIAPPTPVTMRYHNAIPARASLFLRSRSRHYSRDEIALSPSSESPPSEQKRPSVHHRVRRGSLTSARRGTGVGGYGMFKISQDSADAESGMPVTRLVTDIDGLMDQLSSVKHRLSQQLSSSSLLGEKQPNQGDQQQQPTVSPYRRAFSDLSEEGLSFTRLALSFSSLISSLVREHPHNICLSPRRFGD